MSQVNSSTKVALNDAWRTALDRLWEERSPDGCWVGRLSSSALATATAVSALSEAGKERHGELIRRGLQWLAADQNADGGWGDSPESPSNLASTLLCRAAFTIARTDGDAETVTDRAEGWLTRRAGRSPAERTSALLPLYGGDRTFVVPILVNLALAGRVPWSEVPPLPFELGRLPHGLLRFFRAHVVSYALPALIAIGQLLHRKAPSAGRLRRRLRDASVDPTLRRLEGLQPETGGFIEAIPLTSFVVMSLAAAGRTGHPVVRRGVQFLQDRARADGSWPIDSNLSVWLTTLATRAVLSGPNPPVGDLASTFEWIRASQHVVKHPFTGAAPGGWGWTHLAGGVPDADDTAGALLALHHAREVEVAPVAARGAEWLLRLQNSDGGWPTFCRGWGRLPFDRSAADLTAHAIRALDRWAAVAGRRRVRRAVHLGFRFLAQRQRRDGSWIPLWFGNQAAPEQANRVVGTARVLEAYADLGLGGARQAREGVNYLLRAQHDDGGWGGASGVAPSTEETAWAVAALARLLAGTNSGGFSASSPEAEGCVRGAHWLADRVRSGEIDKAAPIGLYFTKLWYAEKLYPLVGAARALGRVVQCLDRTETDRPVRAADSGGLL